MKITRQKTIMERLFYSLKLPHEPDMKQIEKAIKGVWEPNSSMDVEVFTYLEKRSEIPWPEGEGWRVHTYKLKQNRQEGGYVLKVLFEREVGHGQREQTMTAIGQPRKTVWERVEEVEEKEGWPYGL